MRKKLPPRVVGIYRDRDRYRLVICEHGKRKSLILTSQEEAERVAGEIAESLTRPRPRHTVGEGLAVWNSERLRTATCKPLTVREQDARLRAMLADCLTQDIGEMTAEQAATIYQQVVERPTQKSGKPPAAASHRLYLKLCRAFFAWAQENKLRSDNPFAGVKPVGRVQRGKPQLRIDEARRFLATAFQHYADMQEPLAIGAAVALLMGLRTSEVLQRRVRDVEDGAQFLYIEQGKTHNASRRLDVPTVLRPHLLSLTDQRQPEDLLFGHSRTGGLRSRQFMHTLVRRLCQRAGVPPICTHSLRGLYATLGVQSGAVTHAVAASLGHGSFAITQLHYAQPAAVDNATTARVGNRLHEPGPAECPPSSVPLSQLSAEQILAQLDSATRSRLSSLLGRSSSADPSEAPPNPPHPAAPARSSN